MPRVFVAVGHGVRSDGTMDPGATTTDGRSEQSEGDPIAQAMANRLERAGVSVRLVGQGGPNWSGAAQRANSWGADLAVEIHHDWRGAPRGAFGHWWPGSSEGKRAADAMLAEVRSQLDYPVRLSWHRGRQLAWLRTTNMPAVLWESDRIGEVRDHEAYGRALADGVLAYLGVTALEGSEPDEGDDDMALSDEDIDRIAEAVWHRLMDDHVTGEAKYAATLLRRIAANTEPDD